ncbi:hypothetical protein GCM10020369_19160 [Cryptosporangium minutisporangium]|uniref:Uncharacterized protein n=1 Tax=Cryptosporangium minutisporangium TaxID=113569 RepID=A0ABP6SUX3_9ACTN
MAKSNAGTSLTNHFKSPPGALPTTSSSVASTRRTRSAAPGRQVNLGRLSDPDADLTNSTTTVVPPLSSSIWFPLELCLPTGPNDDRAPGRLATRSIDPESRMTLPGGTDSVSRREWCTVRRVTNDALNRRMTPPCLPPDRVR